MKFLPASKKSVLKATCGHENCTEAGYDLLVFTGGNQPMTQKEIQNKNSHAALRTFNSMFSKDQAQSVYLFFSLLRQLTIVITTCACTETFIKFTGIQEKYLFRDPVL